MRTSVSRLRTESPRLIWSGAIVAGLVVGYALVWWAGGTRTPMPHFLYIPVVIAALGGGRKAGVLVGAVAGLLLGPLMPLDTSTGEAQLLNWWLIRTAFFIGVGVVVGEGRRRLLAMEATRQRFVSAIAHEVRTPLSAVLGFSQILNDRATEFDADEILEFVDFINQEVTELHDIIEGYIVAGRLDDSALVFEPKDIQLDKTVEQALSHLPAQILTERISFDLSPARCWADPTRVRQSVRALVAHCLAYADGAVMVSTSQTGGRATVEVHHRDLRTTAELREAFAPMTAIRPEVARPHPVGMGLAVASRLALLMGGSLTHHRTDAGMTLRIHLPPVRNRFRAGPAGGAASQA